MNCNDLTAFFHEESLKNMDSALLSMYCARVAEEDSIHWITVNKQQFHDALVHAAIWHQGQTRANRANLPRTPYIEHPLRNVLRAYRWGIRDGDVLTAIVLHDVIEDCADKITGYETREDNAQTQREEAFATLTNMFSARVAYLVLQVSNEIVTKEEKAVMSPEMKRKNYADHLHKVLGDSNVFIVKLADYMDNAGGLYHNYAPGKEEKLTNMYNKYMLALGVFHKSYGTVRDEFTLEQQGNIEIVLGKVKKNLGKLKDLLGL